MTQPDPRPAWDPAARGAPDHAPPLSPTAQRAAARSAARLAAVPPPRRPAARSGSSRRRPPGSTTAGKAMVVVLAGLLLAALLNSQAMVRATDNLPPGWRRSAVRTVAVPLDVVARAVRLDVPRERLDAALGRRPAGADPVTELPPPAVSPTEAARPKPSGGVRRTPGVSPSRRPAAPAGPRTVTSAKPLRMLVAGDSMVELFGPELVNRIDDGGKVRARIDVKYGTGLVRLDAFDWLAHARDLAAVPSDVTIMMVGGNDAQDIMLRGKRLGVGSREWEAEYARRAGRVMATLTADGRRVIWVGMPVPRSDSMRDSFEVLNRALRTAAARHPRVTYVDIWADYAPGGRYADYLEDASGRTVRVRNRDGIHLAKPGAAMLAAKLRALLLKEWTL